MRRPARVNDTLTRQLREQLDEAGIQPYDGYEVFVTDTRRGRCNYGHKTITVPRWALETDASGRPDEEYRFYYAAHECAHSWSFEDCGEPNHGQSFMEYFKILCPEHLWHFELNYKPRLAAAAGIRK